MKFSSGINGYVGKKLLYKKKKVNRKRLNKRISFNRRVERALESTLKAQNTYIANTSQRLEISTVGTQNYNAVVNILSYADLSAIFTKISTASLGTQGTTSPASKYQIESVSVEIMMKNQGQTGVIVDLYEIIPRNDLVQSSYTAFGTGLTDQNSTGTDLKWGVTPFQSNDFTSLFKILSKTRYLLAPGAIEVLNYRDHKPKVVDYERIGRLGSTAYQMYRGISKEFFAIVRGEPINDSSVLSAVNTSLGAVDFAVSEIYNYSWLQQNVVKTDFTSSMGSITTQDTILEPTGAKITPVVA